MAITTLVQTTTIVDDIDPEQLEPLHQPGCKITRGAGITLPAPSFATAMQLVIEKRASSRILLPIAAVKIQQAWVSQLDSRRATATARTSAATTIQSSWRRAADRAAFLRTRAATELHAAQARAVTALQAAQRRHTAQVAYARQQHAATQIAAAARGWARRVAYQRRVSEIRGPLARIQAAARGWLARRHLAEARRSARTIQTTWRRVRCQVLRRRLARAANALRHGGKLDKYRKRRGGTHERHQRYAWCSDDLQHFLWAPVADRYDDEAVKLRSIPMASITAVCEGVKTPLLKKMERRANEPQRMLSFARQPRAVDEACAFSIICRERVIDFYAADRPSRDRWLRDLKTALAYAHTYDQKAAMAAVEKFAVARTKTSDSDTDDE